MDPKQQLPNASATLVLGILSLVIGCSGIGVILAIIGLILSNEGKLMYDANPDKYDGYGNLNAGRIMCIISLCLYGLGIIIMIFMWGAVIGILTEIINYVN